MRQQHSKGRVHVLAYEKNIHRAKIELVKKRERREAVFRRMHSGIKLSFQSVIQSTHANRSRLTYHDRLPFILDNMT